MRLLLGLYCRDADNSGELVYAASSGQVVNRCCEALKEAVSFGLADSLDELITDVSGLKVREDEDVSLTCNG